MGDVNNTDDPFTLGDGCDGSEMDVKAPPTLQPLCVVPGLQWSLSIKSDPTDGGYHETAESGRWS